MNFKLAKILLILLIIVTIGELIFYLYTAYYQNSYQSQTSTSSRLVDARNLQSISNWSSSVYKNANIELTVEGNVKIQYGDSFFDIKNCQYLITISGKPGEKSFEYPICQLDKFIKIYRFQGDNKVPTDIKTIKDDDNVRFIWKFDLNTYFPDKAPTYLELLKL